MPLNSLETDNNDLTQETLKILINFFEIIMIYYSLKVKNSFMEEESHLKVLAVALAWTTADSVASYLLYFLMNATGEEFKWEYIQSAINCNLEFIERIAVVALVECYDKLKTNNKVNLHVIFILIAKYLFSGLGFKFIEKLRYEDSWHQLIARGVFTLGFALFSK